MSWTDNTDIHVCLCCGQRVEERGKPVTPERAERAFRILSGLGFSLHDLMVTHRAQLDYQSPGLAEWIASGGLWEATRQ